MFKTRLNNVKTWKVDCYTSVYIFFFNQEQVNWCYYILNCKRIKKGKVIFPKDRITVPTFKNHLCHWECNMSKPFKTHDPIWDKEKWGSIVPARFLPNTAWTISKATSIVNFCCISLPRRGFTSTTSNAESRPTRRTTKFIDLNRAFHFQQDKLNQYLSEHVINLIFFVSLLNTKLKFSGYLILFNP